VVRTGETRNLLNYPFDGLAGGRTWWHWQLTPVFQQDQMTGLAFMAMDITREETAQRQNPFFATLSHELRNPLGPILNAVHLIRRAGGSEERIEAACTIVERQAAHLVRMVDDLLEAPCAALAGQRPPRPEEPHGPAPNRPRRILIVEDLMDAAITMELLLEMLGHTVEIAHDGESCLAKAARFAPEIILCDIGLPGAMDGYHVAQTLRATPGLAHVHLVALTGFCTPEDLEQAARAGFDAHLTKPVDPAALGPFIARIAPRGVGV
jgi:CheY-like chemotaxis protein